MQTKTQKWLAGVSTFAFAVSLLGVWAPQADARMVFSTEEGSTNADSYTIDYDDSAGTGEVLLRFGATADKTISYDNATGNFKINDDVSFEENQALQFVLENNNGEVETCNNTRYGRLYYDISDEGTYVCTASGWIDLSKMDGLTANDFLSSNGDDNYSGTGTMAFDAGTTLDVNGTFDADDATVNMNGITNESFTLDEGGTGNNDVILQFGADVGAAITWDDSASRFDFGDDVYINGDLEITGTFTGDLADGTVETNDIEDNAITTAKINTGAVTTDQILDGTITSADIENGTITANDIAANTITSNEIGTNAITDDELADNAVDTNSVQDGAITTDKIADGAITSDKIGTGAITINNLADYSIDGTKIATGSITTDHIADGTITLDDLATRNKSTLISPEFPNFALVGDGSNNLGTLDADRDVANNQNYYSWTSRKTIPNDYDIVVEFQVPDDFESWQTNAIEVLGKADSTDASLSIYVEDTTNSSDHNVSGFNPAAWSNSTFTAANLNGTYTPGENITIGIKMISRRAGGAANGAPQSAYLGDIKFNYVGK